MNDDFTRMLQAAGCRTQKELAEYLGVRRELVSDAKRRKSIPQEWLERLSREKGISPEGIAEGKGSVYLSPCRLRGREAPKNAPYCLEECPAKPMLEQALRLVDSCRHICLSCKSTAGEDQI